MQHLIGFKNSRLNKMFVENVKEMIVFVETTCARFAEDAMIEDCDELADVLTEQIQARFSPALHVIPRDAETGEVAHDETSHVWMSVEPKQKIVRH